MSLISTDPGKTHPSVRLWDSHAPANGYPRGVLPIPEAIAGTAFFPGGYGLWNPTPSLPLPKFPVNGVMVLGHDFHSEEGYRASLERGFESPSQPTWCNLVRLLESVDIEPAECFFTNVYMGLREGSGTTGVFPGASDADFVAHCEAFLLKQLDAQRPSCIITLGVNAPRVLARLSPDLQPWLEGHGLMHLDSVGPVRTGVRFSGVVDFATSVVALIHPSLRHASLRRRQYKGTVGEEAERKMLLDALAS